MKTHREEIIELSNYTRNNTTAISDEDEKSTSLALCIHLLNKNLKKNRGISGVIRFSVFAALITTTTALLVRANAQTQQVENDPNAVLTLQANMYQNQIDLFNQYADAKVVYDETCMQVLPITSSIEYTFNDTSSYQIADFEFPSLNLTLTAENCAATLNDLCLTTPENYFVPDFRYYHEHAAFNGTCCPILYDVCSNVVNFPALSVSSKNQILGLEIGSAFALLAILIEVINTYFTEMRSTLSSPRLFFIPLYKQFSLLSQADERIIRTAAHKYGVTVVENDLNATIENFKAKAISGNEPNQRRCLC